MKNKSNQTINHRAQNSHLQRKQLRSYLLPWSQQALQQTDTWTDEHIRFPATGNNQSKLLDKRRIVDFNTQHNDTGWTKWWYKFQKLLILSSFLSSRMCQNQNTEPLPSCQLGGAIASASAGSGTAFFLRLCIKVHMKWPVSVCVHDCFVQTSMCVPSM